MISGAQRHDLADAVAVAESARADLSDVGGDWAIVNGIPCVRLPVDYPWAVQAKAMSPPDALALAAAVRWMAGWGSSGTVVTRRQHADHAVFTAAGLRPARTLSAMVWLEEPAGVAPVSGLDISAARSAAEFRTPFVSFGVDLAPLVTPRHLSAPSQRYLVGRFGGAPVACAQILWTAGTAYVSAVAVLPEFRGRGVGTAVSVAASQMARARCAGPVWLHAETRLQPLYRRLGYRGVDEHIQLSMAGSPAPAAAGR